MFVSVILPFYNSEATIECCLKSLLNQDYNDYEIIAVNDGSSDNTLKIINDLLKDYPADEASKLRIINHEINRGSGAARATGMRDAKGEYIIQVDADDYVHQNYLSQLIEVAKNDVDIVICQIVKVTKKGSEVICGDMTNDKELLLCRLLDGTLSSGLWNKLIKTSIIKDYDIYPYENLGLYDDLSVSYRAVYFAHSIGYVNEPLYFLNRTSADSLTYSYNENVVPSLNSFRKLMTEFSVQHEWNQTLCRAMNMFFAELSGYMVRSIPPFRLGRYRSCYMSGMQDLKFVWKHPHMGLYAKSCMTLTRWHLYPLVAVAKFLYTITRIFR